MKNKKVLICTGGGGSKLSRATSISACIQDKSRYARDERATRKTAFFRASASGGVSREAQYPREAAFTMAEILLSLTIIGVVAAITLPSLTGNINERTWNTQRKALYARMSQAVALMPALNGYGTFTQGDSSTSAVDTAAETFLTDGLAKVLKINNICDSEHLQDCGIVTSYTNIAGSRKDMPRTLSELNSMFTGTYTTANGVIYQNPQKNIDTKAAAFETQNGESIVAFYNPNCSGNSANTMRPEAYTYVQPLMCANFIYDLNGSKGPNTVGKDIGFMSLLYASDSVVAAPMPLPTSVGGSNQKLAARQCSDRDKESKLPDKEELMSMFYNKELIGNLQNNYHWSSSVHSNINYGYRVDVSIGYLHTAERTAGNWARCVHR